MRIGIDVRYLSHSLTGGVHTYIRHLVPALIAQASEHTIILYADTKHTFELQALPDNVHIRLLPYKGLTSSIHNDLLNLRRAAAEDQIDVLHFPANYGFAPRGTKSIITLHDAINILPITEIIRGHQKNARTVATMAYLHLCTRAALRRADLVLTVSEHARREIARVGRYDPSRIVAVHHAPTPDLQRVSDPAVHSEVRARYGLESPFVLADGLKNPGVLARAWPLLPPPIRATHQLVFFARREPPAVARQAEAAGFARVLINPPRADLVVLYSMASAFAFPSWIEGFGIPLLEAMTCGAPVVASDRGAIPEVVGDAGLLADAEDAQAFAAQLRRVLGEPAVADTLRAHAFMRVKAFSWSATARRTLQAYHEVVATPSTAISRPAFERGVQEP
ncbi:MAG: glycosyltransferase family 4 protein [Chloroflexales bacterium]|nr:glycosyltransferase family 4 protein [Chloroflexales bacterium]